jgi:aromatic ring-cleaving dioxygenase
LRPRRGAAEGCPLNRGGLGILIHPLTGADYTDHSQHAPRLGKPVEQRFEALR